MLADRLREERRDEEAVGEHGVHRGGSESVTAHLSQRCQSSVVVVVRQIFAPFIIHDSC